MAHSAHKDQEMMEEHYDPADILAQKVDKLAAMVQESRHLVAFTGAGISTTAGIPDFRGPDGKWTREAQGKKALVGVQAVKAFPTPTHMSLVDLHKRGKLKYVISQNCDGIHRRSGLPASAISELHGNCNVEICEDCGQQYFRDFRCDRIKPKACDHFTGRFCKCNGRLLNSTIDFGQGLPERPFERAREHSSKADLHLALGSSLTVSPANHMPSRTVKSGGKLIICNLQKTPLTSMAEFQIFAKTDVVMEMLMERLSYSVPPFRLVRRVILGITAEELYAKAVDVHDPTVEVYHICAVDWDGKGVPEQALRDPMIAAAQGGAHRRAVAGIKLQNLRPCLHFVGHYNEPPLQLAADLSGSEGSTSPKVLDLLLTFDPYERTWKSTCQELEFASVVVDDAKIPDYGPSHHEYCVTKVMQARGCSLKDAEKVVNDRMIEGMKAIGHSP